MSWPGWGERLGVASNKGIEARDAAGTCSRKVQEPPPTQRISSCGIFNLATLQLCLLGRGQRF